MASKDEIAQMLVKLDEIAEHLNQLHEAIAELVERLAEAERRSY